MKKLFTLALIIFALPSSSRAMTKAQAQAVSTAVTNANFEADAIPIDATNWRLRARSTTFDVPIATANSLAIAQGVGGFVAEVLYGPMTLAQAQAASTSITNAGYMAHSAPGTAAGTWTVRASSSNVDVPTATAASLATSLGVPAFVAEVEYR